MTITDNEQVSLRPNGYSAHIIACGNGNDFVGPFDTPEAATDYARDNEDGGWAILPLHAPVGIDVSSTEGATPAFIATGIGSDFRATGPFPSLEAAHAYTVLGGADPPCWLHPLSRPE